MLKDSFCSAVDLILPNNMLKLYRKFLNLLPLDFIHFILPVFGFLVVPPIFSLQSLNFFVDFRNSAIEVTSTFQNQIGL